MAHPRPIKIAITAMGGQGGGVLSGWIVKLAEQSGYIAQYTSVPGVAQRTGATVYYIEIFPQEAADKTNKPPILALMPVPGDVDVVIASELMEAGRALSRGFVTKDTTLIASSHRVYAISEKISMGDGRGGHDGVLDLAQKTAGAWICFDMEVAAQSVGCVISSVLFGALAGSGALPFPRQAFEAVIRDSGRAVTSNLAGFDLGFLGTTDPSTDGLEQQTDSLPEANLSPEAGSRLKRLEAGFPHAAHTLLKQGLQKVTDYQDLAYGDLYLDRMEGVVALDKAHGGDRRNWRLTKDVARYLALAMSYEDTIRVADLKIRDTRFERVRGEIRAEPGQLFQIREFFHPRVEEVCDILPAKLGASILENARRKAFFGKWFQKGRRVTTTKLPGFLLLYFLSALKFARRSTYRYAMEESRISNWLDLIAQEVPENYGLACELAGLQRLIKGYGETHERGLGNYNRILSAYSNIQSDPNAHEHMALLKQAALKDEDGLYLAEALRQVSAQSLAAE